MTTRPLSSINPATLLQMALTTRVLRALLSSFREKLKKLLRSRFLKEKTRRQEMNLSESNFQTLDQLEPNFLKSLSKL